MSYHLMSCKPQAAMTTVCFTVQDTLAIVFTAENVHKQKYSDTLWPSLLGTKMGAKWLQAYPEDVELMFRFQIVSKIWNIHEKYQNMK